MTKEHQPSDTQNPLDASVQTADTSQKQENSIDESATSADPSKNIIPPADEMSEASHDEHHDEVHHARRNKPLPKRSSGYQPHPSRKRKWIIGIVAAVIALGGITGYDLHRKTVYAQYENVLEKDTFYEGIYVDEIALGGLTMEEAYQTITEKQRPLMEKVGVTVTYDDEVIPFTYEDVDITFDTEAVLKEAFAVGRSGTLEDRYQYVLALLDTPLHFTTSMSVDPAKLETRVRNIALFRARDVGEPAVEFNPDPSKPKEEWFNYDDPIVGIQTDDEALWKNVLKEFRNETYGTVPVPKWEIDPSAGLVDLKEITQEIVSFKTRQARNTNREHNIALACSMINGTILMPGEEFSMNETTGKRTKAAGFREANTILGGNELVPGIAGGVCQVSGTLFNAAVRADMEISERHHHSFELGYLSRGRDATVNYGTLDLRFINTSEYPVYIAMYTKGRDVYAEIFGAPLKDAHRIGLYVKTTQEIPAGEPVYVKDSTIPAGGQPKFLQGRTGIRCTVYKVYYDENGKQIASSELYKDFYKPYAPEYHVNPADYERYTNPATPTPPPVVTPTPTPVAPTTDPATPTPTTDPTTPTPTPSPSPTPTPTPTPTPSPSPEPTE